MSAVGILVRDRGHVEFWRGSGICGDMDKEGAKMVRPSDIMQPTSWKSEEQEC